MNDNPKHGEPGHECMPADVVIGIMAALHAAFGEPGSGLIVVTGKQADEFLRPNDDRLRQYYAHQRKVQASQWN